MSSQKKVSCALADAAKESRRAIGAKRSMVTVVVGGGLEPLVPVKQCNLLEL